MEAKKLLFEVPCPFHPTLPIQGVDLQNPNQPELLCFTCVLEQRDMTVMSNLKSFPELIQTIAENSLQNKNSIQQQHQKSKEYIDLLSVKDERIEQLCKRIEIEKVKVSEFFDTLIKEVTEILLDKKKQHREELDRQAERLTLNLAFFDKEFTKLCPSDEELANLFPTQESLEKRFQSITKADELKDFGKYLSSTLLKQENEKGLDLNKKLEFEKKFLPLLSKELLKDHAPYYEPDSWKVSEFTTELKKRVAIYFDPVIHLQSPVNMLGYQEKYLENIDSTIVTKDEFSLLARWLPEKLKFKPTLLYRSSKDGKNPKIFHKLCDGKKNTVTIVKALFKDAKEPCVIGGYLDNAWNLNDTWIKSNNAFLFSLTSKFKCPILEPSKAAYGYATLGPLFGYGNCLRVSLVEGGSHVYCSDTFKDVRMLVNKQNATADYNYFSEIEVEVFSLD